MLKVKSKFKNVIYTISFLFRPITPVAVSFVFLVIASSILSFILVNLDESTKTYQVLLAILTGITASLLIAIMIELYNNYHFNVKRQRELRKFFSIVASYEINIGSIIKTNAMYPSILGSGRACAVFCHLKKIIPSLREVLNNRDYLYQAEIGEIDNIIYEYNDVVKIICVNLFGTFMGLVGDEVDDGFEPQEQQKDLLSVEESYDASESIEKSKLNFKSLNDYPSLLEFIEKEAMRYNQRKKDSTFYDEAPNYLESVIEKAIFLDLHIFSSYFEVTDIRSKFLKNIDAEEYFYNHEKDTKFEFRSNMISHSCGEIDKAMRKLQKRVAKEPYYWVMTNYKEKN